MPPPKRPWFRFYVEAVWDRKLRRLSPTHRWLWVTVLACARQSSTPGILLVGDLPMTDEDLADAAALKISEVRAGMSALAEIGLIERTEAWRVVKWDERQYESDNSTKRTRKHRASDGDATAIPPQDVTPPENREQKTDTDTERARPPKRGTKISGKWAPHDQLVSWARSEHPTVRLHVETRKFIDHHTAKGTVFKDWDAAWRNWIRRAEEYSGNNGKAESVPDYVNVTGT